MSVFEHLPTLGLDSVVASLGDALTAFPPTQYMLVLIRICTEFLLDRVVLVILSFLLGAVLVLVAEAFIFWSYFDKAPILPPPKCDDVPTQLPEVLIAQLEHSSLKQKEDCIWLNFLLQFLFSELRDSLLVRRFLTKKIQLEFEEVLKSRSGVLVDELFLRDYHLGDKFPVITGISVERSDVFQDTIQTLDLKTRITYDGGFQIAIDAALPFHRMAFVSVKVLKLRGVLRLQFTQLPFSHWSASFYEEPELELDVTAQLDGRPMPKLKNIIANQIRKIIRKKHTLPMYKMRYKPFFQPRPDPGLAKDTRIHIDGAELGCGILEVTVVEANRLPVVVKGAKVYCTVSVDELPWKEQMLKDRKTRVMMNVELVKNSTDQSLGMTVKDELLPDRLHPIVMIGEVSVGSPAHMANIQQGDILTGVAGNKVTSAKQAMKNLKWAKDRIQIQVERPGIELPTSASTKDDISLVPHKASSWHDGCTSEKSLDTEVLPNSSTNSSAPSQFSTGSPKFRSKVKEAQQQQVLSEGRRTTFRTASVNPQWNHKFIFSVDSSVSYLNICLWSKGGDRTDKAEMISSTKQDVLLGYVSLHLDEIYLHSLVTLNGTMYDRVKLKHGHYKTEDELVKTWSVHKGWDPNQMYGDISLAFHYVPTDLTQEQRRLLSGSKTSSVKLQSELFERYKADEDEQGKPSPARIPEDLKRDLNEGHHQFDNTTFMTATFCDYCGKKIWMKEAFKCQTCSMACHKKCLVKCLVNTVCTDAGAKKRSSVDEAWEPLASTGKLKRPVVADEVVKNFGFQDEDAASQEGLIITDTTMNTSESLQNLTSLFDGIYSEPEQKGLPSPSRQDSMQEATSGTRFRSLKEQTDRMKDNVLKHLRKTKIPTSFNDKAILLAKEQGARLYLDMEPTLRKDKLEELVKKLDLELKAEMENKESVEHELSLLEAAEQKAPSSKRKSEIRALTNKILKSVEKQDAMRLLMLQYCSGLQNCINSLEADVSIFRSKSEFERSQTLPKENEQPKTSRSGAVGGFVRRASSSVKEKMSFIKKDFGKKGGRSEEEDKTSSSKSNNNSGLVVIEEDYVISLQDSLEEITSRNKDKEYVDNLTDTVDSTEVREDSGMGEMPSEMSDGLSTGKQHPVIEICVDEADLPAAREEASNDSCDPNEPNVLSQIDSGVPRSSSDSRLEMSNMFSLRPEDILRYRGTSLPRLLASDDSDSESDYLVIDSSDEHVVTDSSDSDNDQNVGFKDGKKKSQNDNDDDDDPGQHRSTVQHLQTFQV